MSIQQCADYCIVPVTIEDLTTPHHYVPFAPKQNSTLFVRSYSWNLLTRFVSYAHQCWASIRHCVRLCRFVSESSDCQRVDGNYSPADSSSVLRFRVFVCMLGVIRRIVLNQDGRSSMECIRRLYRKTDGCAVRRRTYTALQEN